MSGEMTFRDMLMTNHEHNEIEKLAAANPAAAEALDELEKVAAAEGIDLNTLTHDEIAALIAQAIGEEGGEGVEEIAQAGGEEAGGEKVAQAGGDVPEGVTMEKVAEAEYLGRVMGLSHLATIEEAMGVEKLAGISDITEEQFYELVAMNTNDILHAVGALEQEKHASALADVTARDKVASLALDDELRLEIGGATEQALINGGWNAEVIAEAYVELGEE